MAGGLLMVVGVGCYVFMFATQIVCWIALVGSILFATMQMMQTYEGLNPTIKRLIAAKPVKPCDRGVFGA